MVSNGTYAGGLVAYSRMPAVMQNCAVGASVTGNMYVGGFLGCISANPSQWSVGAPSVKLYGCLFDGAVNVVDITVEEVVDDVVTTTFKEGAYGGCVLGCMVTGNEKYTTLSIGGSVIAGTIRGNSIGGVWGACIMDSAKRTGSNLEISYSLIFPRMERADEESKYGRLLGGYVNVAMPALTEDRAYVGKRVYIGYGEDAVVDNDGTVVMGGNKYYKVKNEIGDAELTDGTYLNLLSLYTKTHQGTTKWSQGADYPLPEGIAQIHEATPKVYFDGNAVEVWHSKWKGMDLPPFIRYYVQLADGTWQAIGGAPSNTGVYRADVALLTERIYGGTTIYFEITKQVIDVSTYSWQDKNIIYYNGQSQTPTLVGLLDSLVVTYGGDTGVVNVGEYTTHIVSVEDPTGNYEIIGVEYVEPFHWSIETRILNTKNIVWSGIPAADRAEGKKTPKLTYNENLQTIHLIDESDPDLDLTALLNITYTGNTATVVGSYHATATIPPQTESSNIRWIGNPDKNPSVWWTIEKREIYPDDYLSIGLLEVTYDGAPHTLDWSKNEPKGVYITPEFSSDLYYVNAGKYTYSFKITLEDSENNKLTSGGSETTIERTFEILPASPILGAKGLETTYTGNVIVINDPELGGVDATFRTTCVAIQEELAACGSIRYEYYLDDQQVDQVVNAGKYTVKVIFEPIDNTNFARTEGTVSLIVKRATCILEGNIVLRDGAVLYNGEAQNLKLKHEEDLPDFVTPVYSEGHVEPGKYTVVCQFQYSPEMAGNYEPLTPMTATLTILTYSLVDEDTGIEVRYPLGSPTALRLLIDEREDVESFNTQWQIEWNTSLKKLYQMELKDGITPVEDFGGVVVELLIPLGKYRFEDTLVPIGLTIDENGKFIIREFKVVDSEYDDDGNLDLSSLEDGQCMFGEIDEFYYACFKTSQISYYGFASSDPVEAKVTWYVVSAMVAVPAAIVLTTVGAIRVAKKIKGKKKDKND